MMQVVDWAENAFPDVCLGSTKLNFRSLGGGRGMLGDVGGSLGKLPQAEAPPSAVLKLRRSILCHASSTIHHTNHNTPLSLSLLSAQSPGNTVAKAKGAPIFTGHLHDTDTRSSITHFVISTCKTAVVVAARPTIWSRLQTLPYQSLQPNLLSIHPHRHVLRLRRFTHHIFPISTISTSYAAFSAAQVQAQPQPAAGSARRSTTMTLW